MDNLTKTAPIKQTIIKQAAVTKAPTVQPAIKMAAITPEPIKPVVAKLPPSEQVGQPLVKLLFVAAVIIFLVA